VLLTEGALDWPLLPNDDPPATTPAPTDEEWATAMSGAIGWLWAQSGRRYGTRAATYRPQAMSCGAGYFDSLSYLQSIYGPLWGQGWPFVGDPRQNRHVIQRVLELPGPTVSVTSVTVVDGDGVSTVLDPSAYRLDGNYLIRTDGDAWPTTQDLIANMGEANTWQVAYVRGRVPTDEAQIAARLLSLEWLKMVQGSADCRIPWNATNVSRAGVAVQLQASLAYRTSGIPLVDRWVTSLNPNGLQEEPRVWTPDVRRNGPPYAGSGIPYRPTGG
jgi:hypothetical protein